MPHYVVGIDVVSINRFKYLLKRYGLRFCDQIFTPLEWEIYGCYPLRLAARLAAKEAVSKAVGVGLVHLHPQGIPATDIEVYNESNGAPALRLYRCANICCENKGISAFSISLSHNTEYATAIAVGFIP